MITLNDAVSTLEFFTSPATSYVNGIKVYSPHDTDTTTEGALKRKLISRGTEILLLGKLKLKNPETMFPIQLQIIDSDMDEINEKLASDFERDHFIQYLHAARVVQLVMQRD
jgi:hypothetical protein